MPTYVTMFRFTEQGLRNIKESPTRLDAVKRAMQAAGGELKAFYLAYGSYDAVVVSELPDEEVVMKLLLTIGAQGNQRTETFRVFTEPEYRRLIASLP